MNCYCRSWIISQILLFSFYLGVNTALAPNALPPKPNARPPPGQSRGKDISNLLEGTNISIKSDEESETDHSDVAAPRGKENKAERSRSVVLVETKRKKKRPNK